jgi:hypothetical protein
MASITTSKFINLIKEQDPSGDRVVFFRVRNELDEMDIVACGDIDDLSLYMKNKHQTNHGDQDVLIIDISLFFNGLSD